MEQGLQSYRQAALHAPAAKQKPAFRGGAPGRTVAAVMRSEHAIIEFEGMRLSAGKGFVAADKRDLLQAMTALLHEERERTVSSPRRLAGLAARLRVGKDYIYTPDTIEEKLKLIDDTLDRQIPAYRQQHGL